MIFSHEKGAYTSRIIPYRGSWLEFEIDQKKELIYAKIDRKKRLLATIFLRALGFDTREKIIELFYRTKSIEIDDSTATKDALIGTVFARAVYRGAGGARKKLYGAGEKIHPHDVEELLHSGIDTVEIIDLDHPESLHSQIILNCFEREEVQTTRDDGDSDEPSKEEAISRVYQVIKPGEPITVDSAEKDLHSMFFSTRRYDLGRVGRYKLNKKFDYPAPKESHTLTPDDIIATMTFLVRVYIGEGNIDDIDHLGNRRVRSVGELLTNQLKVAFTRMERIAKERMSLKEADTIRPQDLISIKPVVATIKEFFGSSQLSQFMDQVTARRTHHKRRLRARPRWPVARPAARGARRALHPLREMFP